MEGGKEKWRNGRRKDREHRIQITVVIWANGSLIKRQTSELLGLRVENVVPVPNLTFSLTVLCYTTQTQVQSQQCK